MRSKRRNDKREMEPNEKCVLLRNKVQRKINNYTKISLKKSHYAQVEREDVKRETK